jgi:hypothetical protein
MAIQNQAGKFFRTFSRNGSVSYNTCCSGIGFKTGAYLLCNLAVDPEEQNNLADTNVEKREALVKKAITDTAHGVGYLCGSSNTITQYCDPANIDVMSKSIQKYGKY